MVRIIFVLSVCFCSLLSAQVPYHFDVEGNMLVGGRIDVLHRLDSNYLFIGRRAGHLIDSTGITDANHSTIIGQRAGEHSNGSFNTLLGSHTGRYLENDFNTHVGAKAGEMTADGHGNSFFGAVSGGENVTGSANSFVGISSGGFNKDGDANTFMGAYAGVNNDSADYNTFIGFQSGRANQGPGSRHNTFIGANAAQIKLFGYENTFLGAESGMQIREGDFNTLVGVRAGAGSYSNPMDYCTFVGYESGKLHEAGPSTFVGALSGSNNTSGEQNTFMGTSSGLVNSTGSENTFVGYTSGFSNTEGSRNSFFGTDAGKSISQGSDNICIGRDAGPTADVSKRLYIDVEQTDKPLIYGEFDNNLVRIFGNLQTEKDQAVLRMETLSNNNGSVVVLRNSTINPNLIGAVNFENKAGETRGQIAYEDDDELAFRVDWVDPLMRLSNTSDHIIMANGAKLTSGGVWTNSCSAALKNLHTKLDGPAILDKIRQLPLYEWSYKNHDQEHHAGPTAEEFYALFGFGNSNQNLAAVDLGGVALAAIQALAQENETLRKELAELRKMVVER